MIPAVDRVLNYVHQRTIQRLTLEAVRTAQADGHRRRRRARRDDD